MRFVGLYEEKKENPRDKYKIIKKLGSGGYGDVYLVETREGQKFAMKIMKIKNPRVRKAAINEVKTLEKLSRLNICDIAVCYKDNCNIDNEIVLIIEYIQGIDLIDIINATTLERRAQNTSILKQLILGINELHRVGITHQDIKEENIRFDRNKKRFRYIDWGLACLKEYCNNSDQATCEKPCGSIGTELMMPPEMSTKEDLQNFPMTIAHDIWSLGIVLLNWYTAKDRSDYERLLSLSRRNQTQQQIDTDINKIKNPNIREIVSLMLRKNWTKRLNNWNKIVNIVKTEFK